MKIAHISYTPDSSDLSFLKSQGAEITQYKSVSEFYTDKKPFDAVIINTSFDREIILSFVCKIRRSQENHIIPIFFETNSLFTLYKTSIERTQLIDTVKNISALYDEIKFHNYTSWENRILAYFYARPYFTIEPELDVKHPMFYYYPLVEQFYDGQEDYFYWLEEMVSQNILTKVKLVDRLFCCPACFSALLKFSDHCPSCGSIDIRNEKFIHCFTCGHVGPESSFLKNERFVCPSCKAKLKLIGEDYDRPLENGVCNDCGAYHIESKLKVHCLTCNKDFSTEDLSKKFIYEYKLSEHGRNQIKFGTINSADMIVNDLNYMLLNHFVFILDWTIKLQERYADDHFSLIAIKIYMDDLSSSFELIVEFSKFLKQTLRTTDLSSKLENNNFVFLLPKTNQVGLEIVLGRLEKFIKSLKLAKGKFDIKMGHFSSTQDNIKNKTAREILSVTAANL